MQTQHYKRWNRLRSRLYTIVFGTDTPAGKLFDIVLLYAILASIVAVMLESVQEIHHRFGNVLIVLEWVFTVLFTLEYLLRIFISKKPRNYILSPLGIIDLLAVLPTYLAIFISGGSYLMVVRSFRLLRVFRILKLTRYLREARILSRALKASRQKIIVFMMAVFTIVLIMGTLMYMIEGAQNGFTSIPRSIYWAIVTVTTVGYGDIAPQTTIGQAFAAFLMLLGYAIIAVPTGIVTAQITADEMDSRRDLKKKRRLQTCKKCGNTSDQEQAVYCDQCGSKL